jgi:DNA-binding PadR family transcriptional regulator
VTALDFVLSLIAGFGGQIQGRTLLQKRAYFVAQLSGVSIDLRYDAHYYGPYSAVVDNSIERLKSLGFLAEENIGFGVASRGFEMKRYDYRVTEDGRRILASLEAREDYKKIERSCIAILEAGDPSYFVLSIAAKADFILGKRGRAMTRAEIIREAGKFDWDIQEGSLGNAVDFLEKLGVVQTAEKAS